MNIKQILSYRPGPGMLVTAAFIGPGTVTAASMAGANFGYALLWALVFATIATIFLQSFVTRITLVSGQALGQLILSSFQSHTAKIATIILLFSALLIGNAAYEAGNISGAALGLNTLTGHILSENPLSITSPANVIGLFILILLFIGKIERITQFLIILVVIMSLSFLTIFFITRPDMIGLLQGLIPTIPNEGIFTAMALIGTTIVPYNLFLHASNVRKKWTIEKLDEAKTESAISITLGGLVSIAILASAANVFFVHSLEINSLSDMAVQMEPLFGSFATQALAIGLLAAGLTSALTAPLATAYIVTEIWQNNDVKQQNMRFKCIAAAIVVIGMLVSMFEIKPLEIILFAQVANGLLLPFVAIFLFKISANRKIMGTYCNTLAQNVVATLILFISIALGLRLILRASGVMP